MPYDLKSLKVPKLSGNSLRAMVSLLENGYSRRLLEFPLLKEAGLDRLRKLDIHEAPCYVPKHPLAPAPAPDKARASLAVFQREDFPAQTTPGFHFHSVQDFARAYRSGETSPTQVAERVIDAIKASNSGEQALRAIISWNEQDIRAQARASEERIKAGKALGPLDGVPVAIKDELDQVPYASTSGTRIFGHDHSAAHDATVVARLRAAGALLIGKTNMQEIGFGVTGSNPHHGVCRNPYNPAYHSGGSSSGSAAAVAAGLCPIALGVDGGGSVRVPAALCGLVSLKPTWSRVSTHGDMLFYWSLAHVGPLGTNVDDVALAYSLISGPDPQDRWTLEQPPVHLDGYLDNQLHDIRLGVYTPWFNHGSRLVVQTCQLALETLKRQGASVQEVAIDQLDAQRVAHAVLIATEILTAVDEEYRRDKSRFGWDTRLNLGLAQAFTGRDYVKAQRVRARAIQQMRQAFEQVDIIVTPTTAIEAPEINEKALPVGEANINVLDELMRYVTIGNMTGCPALTLPVGYTPGGLPIGLQLIGRPWEEHLLLRVARSLEAKIERQKPMVYHALL